MSSSILTLEELADYLKLSPEVILNQANQGKLPGRKIEDTWRFLKDAIDDWLRTQDSRTILLQQAGVFADDPALTEIRKTILSVNFPLIFMRLGQRTKPAAIEH